MGKDSRPPHAPVAASEGFKRAQIPTGTWVAVWNTADSGAGTLPVHAANPVRVVYHTGKGTSSHNYPGEYNRQLARQYYALSQLSADDYLRGRMLYKRQGRTHPTLADMKAREEFQRELVWAFQLSEGYGKSEAQQLAAEVMAGLAMLHEPDQTLGRRGAIARDENGHIVLGRSDVNSSIGSQHRVNVTALDRAARDAQAQGRGDCCLNIEVVVTHNPRLVSRLRSQAVDLSSTRSSAERPAGLRSPPRSLTPHDLVAGTWPGAEVKPQMPPKPPPSGALIDYLQARANQMQAQESQRNRSDRNRATSRRGEKGLER